MVAVSGYGKSSQAKGGSFLSGNPIKLGMPSAIYFNPYEHAILLQEVAQVSVLPHCAYGESLPCGSSSGYPEGLSVEDHLISRRSPCSLFSVLFYCVYLIVYAFFRWFYAIAWILFELESATPCEHPGHWLTHRLLTLFFYCVLEVRLTPYLFSYGLPPSGNLTMAQISTGKQPKVSSSHALLPITNSLWSLKNISSRAKNIIMKSVERCTLFS